jgi:Fic family protein
MLFRTPPITEREAEVIDEIEAIRQQLTASLPSLREWPGLPRRAIHARVLEVSASLAGRNVLLNDAIAAADDDALGALSADDESAAAGYRAALTFVLQLADAPDFAYDEGVFRALHHMMMAHDPVKTPGRWRRSSIWVRQTPSGNVVYVPPPPKFIPALMAELIESLNARNDSPVLIRAAMAHLNLAAIHPFLDGNGRMARALQTLVLARDGVSAPPFSSIDEYLSVNGVEYGKVLQEVDGGTWQPERDARPWIRFCLTAHFRQASTLRRRTQEYDRLWEELEREVARRGLPERVISALAEAAIGSRSTGPLYQSVAGVPAREADRDMKRLVGAGLLVEASDKLGPRYLPADPVKAIRTRTRDSYTADEDPFATRRP